ncbi:MAG: DUF5647 family protein [Candidatus Binatia bacterium]
MEEGMSNDKTFEKNVSLNTEFTRYALEHPDILDQIPNGARLVFLPEDDPELCQRNIEMAKAHPDGDRPIAYVRMKKVPQVKTVMITVPEIEIAGRGEWQAERLAQLARVPR